jgi:hypothetical protein
MGFDLFGGGNINVERSFIDKEKVLLPLIQGQRPKKFERKMTTKEQKEREMETWDSGCLELVSIGHKDELNFLKNRARAVISKGSTQEIQGRAQRGRRRWRHGIRII